MNEQYRMEVSGPMFHLAERNLLLKIFQEHIKIYSKNGKMKQEEPRAIKLKVSRNFCNRGNIGAEFSAIMQRGEHAEKLPKKLECIYQISLYKGWLVLNLQVCSAEELSDTEVGLMKILVVDVAETLKLFGNGDGFMKLSVEKLVAKIAEEIGVADPAAWIREYLARPQYMERPEVRRYYRLYDKHLNHAHPQDLLRRTAEELVETSV